MVCHRERYETQHDGRRKRPEGSHRILIIVPGSGRIHPGQSVMLTGGASYGGRCSNVMPAAMNAWAPV